MTVPPNEAIREYPVGQYPYVEVTLPGERLLHARIKAWAGDLILIEYPPRTAAGTFEGDPELRWVDKGAARRVRRADALWAHSDDDMQWHADQDKTIDYRADPWLVYKDRRV
ncbi:hypothetical protein [Glutamicibacter sp.]|uniref:hypothetical protein n=1 Tax=Glutamicibacter sp. TaxID=1931995 RepID=UPI0028BE9485|nr:hypothetical protein [Glutamicibacter sp.]